MNLNYLYRIAFIGAVSSGKSTLINQLLETELPVKSGPCTNGFYMIANGINKATKQTIKTQNKISTVNKPIMLEHPMGDFNKCIFFDTAGVGQDEYLFKYKNHNIDLIIFVIKPDDTGNENVLKVYKECVDSKIPIVIFFNRSAKKSHFKSICEKIGFKGDIKNASNGLIWNNKIIIFNIEDGINKLRNIILNKSDFEIRSRIRNFIKNENPLSIIERNKNEYKAFKIINAFSVIITGIVSFITMPASIIIISGMGVSDVTIGIVIGSIINIGIISNIDIKDIQIIGTAIYNKEKKEIGYYRNKDDWGYTLNDIMIKKIGTNIFIENEFYKECINI